MGELSPEIFLKLRGFPFNRELHTVVRPRSGPSHFGDPLSPPGFPKRVPRKQPFIRKKRCGKVKHSP